MGKSSASNYKYDEAYHAIRDMIIHHRVLPRQLLSENELSAKLGVSRTPVRSALMQLAHEGLVMHIPDKGMFVSELRLTDLLEIAEIRLSLECLAARLCAVRISSEELGQLSCCLNAHRAMDTAESEAVIEADNAFHMRIAAGARNPRLCAFIRSLLDSSARIAFIASKDARRLPLTLEQHTAIFDAIARGDGESASAAMERHIKDWVEYTHNVQRENYYLFR